jgi:hypothetical protein
LGLKTPLQQKWPESLELLDITFWKPAGQLEVDYFGSDLLPLTIKELVAIKPKASRPKVLRELESNVIFAACTASKKPRESNNLMLHKKTC